MNLLSILAAMFFNFAIFKYLVAFAFLAIYIPPHGELRGGAWVVLDPKINPDHMEMFADVEARGGILEPPAASDIVFKGGNSPK